MTISTQSVNITRFSASRSQPQDDLLSVEEPLEISIRYGLNLEIKNLSVTMRTPGHDEELALGFLLSEGIITNYEQVIGAVQEDVNRVSVILHEDTPFDPTQFERHIYTTSSCGICAKSSIEAVRVESTLPEIIQHWTIEAPTLYRLPELLRERQADFASTGGLHAAALFTQKGELLSLREDVGRHNALDKLIGHALQTGTYPLRTQVLLLSGRASFELIQKAALAGISFVAAVGAPSTLAVQLAKEMKLVLIGFLRDTRFNVYSGVERIAS
ncbi:formate dehydrogenase accessory sulfurtransferase FdhD [Persicitalea jodogahamensis]|uniref:Sulfur carrier protein FdhD n=1 Tax=Persicitalea jodogahamensis TaxID=402147 RepID=A0A8J3G7P3_9BACT|nr:formate dehydrogenase accessory sulfurtransferase FdhD [Persicitalea jodogahamensis]GHB57401.1 sulfurtransferase FdhD [Persicitalea jodogahamensis]